MADKALLAGINNYKHISDLRGCINDVRNVKGVLTEVFHFDAANVRELTDGEATKKAILQNWKWLLSDTAPGDRIVFHFSGHGSHTVDRDGDEDDGADELICLYDMDWDDEQSYLLDDDLRKLTGRVAAGVNLTVIFDSCHSGTATRMAVRALNDPTALSPQKVPLVDLETAMNRAERGGGDPRRSMNALRAAFGPSGMPDATTSVLARFVEPPPRVLAAMRAAGVRKRLRATDAAKDSAAMNHVLLAGSHATQTSADAMIDGDFHGAFSFYLCKTVRERGASVEYQDLISRVRATLRSERFSQVPQLEPETTVGVMLGGKSSPRPSAGQSQPNAGVLNDILDVLVEIRDTFKTSPAADRAAGSRALAYVHGICRHDAGYSQGWWESLRPHLSAPVRAELESNRREVLWSDLVSSETRAFEARPLSSESERALAETLRDVLEDRAANRPGGPLAGQRELLGIPGVDCIDDFVKYLLRDSIRRAVQQRFLDVVEPRLAQGMAVEVVSHSWGTVVAYEALRNIDHKSFAGHVHTLFTVGSALSIAPVRRRLEIQDGRRPRHARRWVNVDARGDLVGGPLQSAFEVDLDAVDLPPHGCGAVLGVVSPACAHSSYFTSGNASVNRDVFAAQIEHA
jgi:metacaspase-1